ncbi:hypothetical protein F5887DRAFT_1088253 [Amanita rubescens]|nr:hypothetical protein F5887DRAFT_1088253 [Amanita rubescens]
MPDTIQIPFSGKPAYGHCMNRECPGNGKEFHCDELKEVRNPKTQEKRVFCKDCVEFLTQRFTSSQVQAQANNRDVAGAPDARKGSGNEIKGNQISEDRAKRVQRDIARAQRGKADSAAVALAPKQSGNNPAISSDEGMVIAAIARNPGILAGLAAVAQKPGPLGTDGLANMPVPPISVPGVSRSNIARAWMAQATGIPDALAQDEARFRGMAYAHDLKKSITRSAVKATLICRIPGKVKQEKLAEKTILVDIGVSYIELQIALWEELQKDWALQYPDIPVRADQVIVQWQNHLRLDEEGRRNEQGVKLGAGVTYRFRLCWNRYSNLAETLAQPSETRNRVSASDTSRTE